MKTRLIAKLDAKPPYIIKPIFFEGLRKIGDPKELALKYYLDGIDEIYYIDVVASLYRREILKEFIKQVSQEIQVPFCAGGGIKNLDDVKKIFDSGADKISINTYAIQENPNIINEVVKHFGSQAIAINIEAKKIKNEYYCYTDCGRNNSKKRVFDWIKEVEDRGAGEIFLQSVDRDGWQKGFDIDLAQQVVSLSSIPVVVASGAGSIEDILNLDEKVKPSGIAISSFLHYSKTTPSTIKENMKER